MYVCVCVRRQAGNTNKCYNQEVFPHGLKSLIYFLLLLGLPPLSPAFYFFFDQDLWSYFQPYSASLSIPNTFIWHPFQAGILVS